MPRDRSPPQHTSPLHQHTWKTWKIFDASLPPTMMATELLCGAVETPKKPSHIRKLLTSGANAAKTRAPSLHNALVHHKVMEVNAGTSLGAKRPLSPPHSYPTECGAGDRASLTEIQGLLASDQGLQHLSKGEKKEIMGALVEHRATIKTGARASNRSAVQHCQSTMKKLHGEMRDLSERVGSRSFAFFTRGHIHDSTTPGWLESGNTIGFFREVLDLDPIDVAARFEQWSCAKERVGETDTLQILHVECACLISDGLWKLVNTTSIAMCYLKYDTDIVIKHSVEIRGWPSNVPFASPSTISTLDNLHSLHNALEIGDCRWNKLTPTQQGVHTEAYKKRVKAGEVVVKKRKMRTDIGSSRNKGTLAEGVEGNGATEGGGGDQGAVEPPKKKQHRAPKTVPTKKAAKKATAMLPPAFKSCMIIEDEGDEDNGDKGET